MTDKPPAGPHPSAEELVAFHAGELPAEAREPLSDHLARCRRCARTLLDLAGESRAGDPFLDRAWDDLLPRVRRRLNDES